MKKLFFTLTLVAFVLLGWLDQATAQVICELPDLNFQPEKQNESNANSLQCPGAAIDFEDYDLVAPITIYVNVHFQPTDAGENFGEDEAVNLANELVNTANNWLNNMDQNEKPGPNGMLSTHVPRSKWQYKIYTENLPGDDLGGIWIEPNANSGMYNSKVIDIWMTGSGKCYSGFSGYGGIDIYINGFYFCHDDEAWGLPVYAKILNHEFGHSLTLQHSSYCNNQCKTRDIDPEQECGPNCPQQATCDCENPCKIDCPPNGMVTRCTWNWGNNLMQQGLGANAITPCQWETVFNYVLNSNNPKYSWADKCSELGPTYYVHAGTNEVWDDLKILNRDVEVETGATLTITCEVRMATGTRIIVHRGAKLTVDGGKITNLCPDGLWGGIFVYGNASKVQPNPSATLASDDAGVVMVKNNSLIEHAPTAISTSAPGVSYGEQVASWGGLVIAENSSFVNNRRAVEFMKYNFTNKSLFNNCDFGEEGNWAQNTVGVTIWSCNGIKFTGNRFTNLDLAGISGIDYGAIVTDGNNFDHVNRGIESQATRPYATFIDVYNNHFNNNTIHVFSSSSDKLDGLRLKGNEFFNADYGVWIEGPAKYDVRSNSFLNGTWGTVSWKTGVQNNYIDCNTIQGVTIGSNFVGNNSNLQFRDNTYLQTTLDVQLDKVGSEKGQIRSVQGAAGKPADNCFFNGNSDDIRALSTGTVAFTYLHRVGESGSCFKPTNNLTDGGTNNYSTNPTSGTLECPPPFEDGVIGNPPYVVSDLTDMRNLVTSVYGQLQGHPNDMTLQIAYENAVTGKNKVLLWLIAQALENGDYNQAETYLTGENTKEAKKWIYGLKIERGDYTGATTALNAIPQDNADDQSFVSVQHVNLDRLQATAAFNLSPAQENLLRSVAESDYSSRGYARALLGLLQGERFEVSLDLPDGIGGDRSVHKKAEKNDFAVFPNPTKDVVNVRYPVRQVQTDAYCQLTDIYGRVLHSVKLDNSGSVIFDTTPFNAGLYSLQIVEQGSVTFNTILSIIR